MGVTFTVKTTAQHDEPGMNSLMGDLQDNCIYAELLNNKKHDIANRPAKMIPDNGGYIESSEASLANEMNMYSKACADVANFLSVTAEDVRKALEVHFGHADSNHQFPGNITCY